MLPTSKKLLLNVEGLNDARTKLADCFSILLRYHGVFRQGKQGKVSLPHDPSGATAIFSKSQIQPKPASDHLESTPTVIR